MDYEEFEKEMHEKHPVMFSHPYGGFAIGEGWYHIIRSLCADIQSHLDWKQKCRKREVDKFIAREQGIEALVKFYSGGHREPTEWEIEQAEEVMQSGVEIPDEIPPVIIQQIKEKFGGLRFYYQGGDDIVDGMIRMAERWADHTCEKCGNLGERRSGGWIRTLCDTHEAEHQAKLAKMKDEDGDQE